MGLTILHAADLHLGSPLRALSDASESMANRLGRATYDSFRRIISAAIDRNVDFVVIAGDMYDREARSITANDVLTTQFERLDDAEIPCYIVHGNQDSLGDGVEKLEFPKAFTYSAQKRSKLHTFPRRTTRQLGCWGNLTARNMNRTPSTIITGLMTDQCQISVFYTGLNPDQPRYAPCSPTELASKEIDYWALGHIHTPRVIDTAPAAYAGIPQGRHIGEL